MFVPLGSWEQDSKPGKLLVPETLPPTASLERGFGAFVAEVSVAEVSIAEVSIAEVSIAIITYLHRRAGHNCLPQARDSQQPAGGGTLQPSGPNETHI